MVTVKRSKTDPEGARRIKGHRLRASRTDCCVARALDAWLEASGIVTGSLLRAVAQHGHLRATRLHDGSVAHIVQRVATRAGLDRAKIGGHSLHAGFATTAAKRGKSLDASMRQTLRKSGSVARGYIRHARMFEDIATVGLL